MAGSKSRRGVAAMMFVALVALAACGGGGSGGNAASSGGSGGTSGSKTPDTSRVGSGPDAPPDKKIKLQPNVVVVKGDGGKVIKGLGDDGASMLLDGSAKGVKDLEPGKVLLITGVTAVRVAQVEEQGNDVAIGIEPATLPEVIKDGSFEFDDLELDPERAKIVASSDAPEDSGHASDPSTEPLDPSDVDGGSGESTLAPITSPNALPVPDVAAPRMAPGEQALRVEPGRVDLYSKNVSGKVGGLSYDLSFEPSSGNSSDISIKVTSTGDFEGSIDAKVHLNGLKFSGGGAVKNGKTSNFELKTDQLSGTADIKAQLGSGKQLTSFSSPQFLKIPATISFPAIVGGIPFTLTLKVTIEVHLSIALDHNTLNGEAKISYDGDAGFSFRDGSVKLSGDRKQNAPNLLPSLKGVAAGPVGMVFTAQLPKVSFGFNFLQTGAGVYIANGMSTSMWLAGAQSPIPCARIQVAYVLAGGVDASFLGHDVDIARKAFVDKRWAFYSPKDPRCDAED